MTKAFSVILVALALGCVIVWVCLINGFYNSVNEYKSHIGDTLIIVGDTAIVLDYSIMNENFTLSNGKVVSAEIVINKK